MKTELRLYTVNMTRSAATTTEISNSVSHISNASQTTEQQLNELMDISKNLSRLSDTLKETVSIFKIA